MGPSSISLLLPLVLGISISGLSVLVLVVMDDAISMSWGFMRKQVTVQQCV